MTKFLNKIKNFIVPRLKRESWLFRLLRRAYVFLLDIIGRRQKRLLDKARKIIKEKNFLVSCTVGLDTDFVEFADGRKFIWRPADTSHLLSNIVNSRGNYELAEGRLFSKIIYENDVVFDIGANFGWHTIDFLKLVGKGGAVYAFEPAPDVYGDLVKNIGLNGDLCRNIFTENIALGESDGIADFYLPVSLGSAFATLVEGYNNDYNYGNTLVLKVRVERLDSYVKNKQLNKIDFIKCDVEGSELSVLKGADELLRRSNPPMFFMEVNHRGEEDIFSGMRKSGYSAYYFNGGKLHKLESFKDGARRRYSNFLFSKPAHLKRIGSLIE